MPRQDPVCSLEVHDELKRDVETFRQSCTYIGTQEALDHLVELRLCVRCGSTLGIPIPASRSRAPGTRLRRDQVRPVVLIVDDDDAIREAIREVLEEAGCEVMEAPDGSAGLREMRRVRPALVLTDLVMPGLDGIGLLESMREDPALAAIPVVALSAAIWADRVSPSVEFIAKPFSIEKLLEIVGRHVR